MNLRKTLGVTVLATVCYCLVSGKVHRMLGLRHTGGDILSEVVAGVLVTFVAMIARDRA